MVDFLGSGLRRIRGIQFEFPAALKVPTDSQLLHHTLHLRPCSFSNTEILQTATWGANNPVISLFTFTVWLRADFRYYDEPLNLTDQLVGQLLQTHAV